MMGPALYTYYTHCFTAVGKDLRRKSTAEQTEVCPRHALISRAALCFGCLICHAHCSLATHISTVPVLNQPSTHMNYSKGRSVLGHGNGRVCWRPVPHRDG